MLIVPELIMYKYITGLVTFLKNDYNAKTDKSKTLLYEMFYGLLEDKKNYYEDAVSLFTREQGDGRLIEVRKFFDAKRADIPTIHITIPQDLPGQNSLGMSETDETESWEEVGDTVYSVRPLYQRRFDCKFYIVCSSDNHAETMVMYHALRAGILSTIDTLTLSGLEKPVMDGNEVKLDESLAPPHIFHRGIGIACSYDIKIPRWNINQQISDINVCDVTTINSGSEEPDITIYNN